jgi:hypothetical protein
MLLPEIFSGNGGERHDQCGSRQTTNHHSHDGEASAKYRADNVSLVMVEVCFSPLLIVALTANTNL